MIALYIFLGLLAILAVLLLICLLRARLRKPTAALTPERAAALQSFAFSGIHCVAPRVLPLMDSYPPKSPIMDFYLDHCHDLHIQGIAQPNLRLLDVGKTDTLAAAADFLSADPL